MPEPCPYCANRTAAFLRWCGHLEPEERDLREAQLNDSCGGPACRTTPEPTETP